MLNIRKQSLSLGLVVLVLGTVLSVADLSQAHEKASPFDGHNYGTRLDLKRAWFDHNDNRIFMRIQTRGGFSNSLLRRRAFFGLNIRKEGQVGKGFYRVAVFRNYFGWQARILRFPPGGGDGYTVGWGTASRVDADQVRLAFKRTAVAMTGDRFIRWTAMGWWCEKVEDGKCAKSRIDWIPNRGSIRHHLL